MFETLKKRKTMKTYEAIAHVLKHDKNSSNLKLSKALGCTHTTIANYLKGKGTMSRKVYEKFKVIYPSIGIDDIRENNQGGGITGNGKLGTLTYE